MLYTRRINEAGPAWHLTYPVKRNSTPNNRFLDPRRFLSLTTSIELAPNKGQDWG